MEKWEQIDLADGVSVGVTDEGFQFIEIEIDGWNDNQNFSDLETIAYVRATEHEESIEVTVHAINEGITDNKRVKALIDDAINQLKEEVKIHF